MKQPAQWSWKHASGVKGCNGGEKVLRWRRPMAGRIGARSPTEMQSACARREIAAVPAFPQTT